MGRVVSCPHCASWSIVRPVLFALAIICPIVATITVINYLTGKYSVERITLAHYKKGMGHGY
jgi:hypothetical protein